MIVGSYARRGWVGMRASALLALLFGLATGCRIGELNVGDNLPDNSDAGDAGIDGGLCVPESTTECYTGPAGTSGVGLCRPGAAICNADGMGYGDCVGPVLPQVEDCATPVDEDCDGLAPPCKGAALWSKRFGDASDQIGYSIAVDSGDSILITGEFSGGVDFGGGALASAGSTDAFLVKLDADGTHLWSKRFGDLAAQIGRAVATDQAGNALLTGSFEGVADLGGVPLQSQGDFDILLAKFDADGNHVWSKQFGDPSVQGATAIAADGAGNVLITGCLEGAVEFGGGLLASAGNCDVFLAKFDGMGAHVWSKHFGGTGDQVATGLAADIAGNILVTGFFTGAVDFGGDLLVSAGSEDAFIAKFDALGNHVWSKRFGDEGPQVASDVAADSQGKIAAAGYFDGQAGFGADLLTSAGSSDAFLARLDVGGNHEWTKRFGDASGQVAQAIAVDNSGNVLVSGNFTGTVDFGGGPLASAGNGNEGEDVYLVKLDTDGNHLWSKRFGDALAQGCYDVAADNSGNALVTGLFYGTIDFGNGPLVSAGSRDVFIAKFSP